MAARKPGTSPPSSPTSTGTACSSPASDLLLHPQHQVALALDDVEELAREEGQNLWEMAGGFAQRMLPGVFRRDDSALELSLPVETQRSLEKLLTSLPATTFTAHDSLGWTYQYWQADRKEQVNQSNEPRGADEIPAVTQLFTEDYMVEFLLHNTLGTRWATANQTETPPPLPEKEGLAITWKYHREPENLKSQISNFKTPTPWADFRLLDPSMGSGHFLVFALPLLTRLRMEDGLSKKQAVLAVLRENLHGLELDPRCCQIGAFNLALAAWRLIGEYQELPPLHIACCGLPIRASKADWQALAPAQGYLTDQLHDLFSQAPVLGSLIDPARQLYELQDEKAFADLLPVLEESLRKERAAGHFEEAESGVTARGLASAYRLLRQSYDLVITNVPYLGSGKQHPDLKKHIEKYYSDGKKDLATAFVLRAFQFLAPGGTTALVTPQNWLFLGSYKHLRKTLLEEQTFDWIARLGEHGFQSSAAAGAFTALVSLTRRTPDAETRYQGLDVSQKSTPLAKDEALQSQEIVTVPQLSQLNNPNWVIALEKISKSSLLEKYATSFEGAKTVDIERFRSFSWEVVSPISSKYSMHVSSPSGAENYSGFSYISAVRTPESEFVKNLENYYQVGKKVVGWECGKPCWGKHGLAVSWMRHLPHSIYLGSVFDNSAAVLLPREKKFLLPIKCFVASGEYLAEIRKINQKVQVAAGTMDQVPFDLAHWQKVADEKYPDGLPEPYSNDPTQWLFKGRIDDTAPEHVLHVATARLLGYRWPAELDAQKAGVKILAEDEAHWELCAPHADADGIVCLPALNQEDSAADRLSRLLASALPAGKHADLLAATGTKKTSLADWLRDDFFKEHCKLFSHRPFIWHLSDGRNDGFHALVNYHQLAAPNGGGRKLLETLTYTYLGDWIRRQQEDATEGKPGAEDRLAAAQTLQQELKNILTGEPPYDLFIRWKPLHAQPQGWNPDLNDGVRLNIRPFMLATAMKSTAAGLLRWKPNIHWKSDRGKEPARPVEDFPWFHTWDNKTQDFKGTATHDGTRHNALHYTLAAKQASSPSL